MEKKLFDHTFGSVTGADKYTHLGDYLFKNKDEIKNVDVIEDKNMTNNNKTNLFDHTFGSATGADKYAHIGDYLFKNKDEIKNKNDLK
jgi:hypothetical protein